ncbi:MAG TPA: hypothetical protein PKD72_06870, partial [Gemmatales bacterium]|nr:hypothetical protein [Gemmatales bacterium]
APGSSRIETHFPAQVVVLDSIAKLKFQVDNRGKLDQTKSEPYSPTMIMSEARAWLNPPHTGFAQSLQGFHCPADIPWMVLCMEVSRV